MTAPALSEVVLYALLASGAVLLLWGEWAILGDYLFLDRFCGRGRLFVVSWWLLELPAPLLAGLAIGFDWLRPVAEMLGPRLALVITGVALLALLTLRRRGIGVAQHPGAFTVIVTTTAALGLYLAFRPYWTTFDPRLAFFLYNLGLCLTLRASRSRQSVTGPPTRHRGEPGGSALQARRQDQGAAARRPFFYDWTEGTEWSWHGGRGYLYYPWELLSELRRLLRSLVAECRGRVDGEGPEHTDCASSPSESDPMGG